MKKWQSAALWAAIALPALYQIALLATAVAGRLRYPYDLEWMEGGLLHHALRLQQGRGIYAPPSVDFIPYLYTPLYPALLAVLGKMFGLGYTLGRTISMLSLVGLAPIAALIVPRRGQPGARGPAWAGAAIALGLFAAVYPYVEGWYDLVRADTFFLFLATAGVAAAAVWTGEGRRAHAKVAAIATVLVLAFLAKQTGVFYIALAGAIIAVRSPRYLPTFVVAATVVGVTVCAAVNIATDGWFWIYVSKIHRAHDFNMDRFWKSFGFILWHFRAMTVVVIVGLVATAVCAIVTRELPRGGKMLIVWSAAYAVSTVVGAVGWGTQFAHFNAYIPAFLHGALAAGAALPVLHAVGEKVLGRWGGLIPPLAAAGALAYTCYDARWEPKRFLPTAADVAAGDKLIARIGELEGEIWVPSHPWYAVLAGKEPMVHRMGVKDVTTGQTRHIDGLDEALRDHRFSAIVLDDHDLQNELPIGAYYHAAFKLPADERPHVRTGAGVTPDSIWLPRVPVVLPAGATAVFDFEQPVWGAWQRSGPAWGDGPAEEPVSGQPMVVGAGGTRFATSMHGGDVSIGRMRSPEFALASGKLSLALAGGTDATKLRVELWVDGAIARTASVPAPGGETLKRVELDIGELRGKQGYLVLVDEDPHGHLDVDDVWLQ